MTFYDWGFDKRYFLLSHKPVILNLKLQIPLTMEYKILSIELYWKELFGSFQANACLGKGKWNWSLQYIYIYDVKQLSKTHILTHC